MAEVVQALVATHSQQQPVLVVRKTPQRRPVARRGDCVVLTDRSLHVSDDAPDPAVCAHLCATAVGAVVVVVNSDDDGDGSGRRLRRGRRR